LKINFEITNYLKPQESLDEVQALLQHAIDHDGSSPVGEHIYLKLRAGQPELAQGIARHEETAAAILAYTNHLSTEEQDLPEWREGKPILIGYLQFLVQPDQAPPRIISEIIVHPHFRRHKIGTYLMAKMREIAKKYQINLINMWSYHHKAGTAIDFFSGTIQAQPGRVLYNMRRPANLPLPPISTLPDFQVRAFEPGQDNEEWLNLNRLVFADHPENGSWTAEDLHLRFNQNWFNPQDFLVLTNRENKIVGWHWTKITPERYSDLHISPEYPNSDNLKLTPPAIVKPGSLGEIYIVGLHPIYHGKGLGRFITLIGMHHLVNRGCSTLTLYVDENNVPAVKLYKSLDFTIHHEDVCYSLKL
jgi:mycothiol synthase